MPIDQNQDLDGPTGEQPAERRRLDRARDDADWESKVVGRLNGSLHRLEGADQGEDRPIGWETSVLDVLRRRIEKGPG